MKVIASLLLIVLTLVTSAGIVLSSSGEDIENAQVVETKRHNVFQTIGLQGQLVYADDGYVLAAESGRIDNILVKEEQRVIANEMIVQYQEVETERIAEVYVRSKTNYSAIPDADGLVEGWINRTVQRIDKDCTVRQVLVSEGELVTQGMPIMRVSASDQEIRCLAAQADAERIQTGMWGWVSWENESCLARVTGIEKAKDDNGLIRYVISMAPEKKMDYDEGYVVDVDIYLAGSVDVVTLPLSAITDRDTVWWVNEEQRCIEISAEIVMCDEINAWVNLPEGIRVAVGEFEEGQVIREAAN